MILRQGVPGLGEKGVIVKVPNGFFRNYLKPRGLAVPLTEGILKYVFNPEVQLEFLLTLKTVVGALHVFDFRRRARPSALP